MTKIEISDAAMDQIVIQRLQYHLDWLRPYVGGAASGKYSSLGDRCAEYAAVKRVLEYLGAEEFK